MCYFGKKFWGDGSAFGVPSRNLNRPVLTSRFIIPVFFFIIILLTGTDPMSWAQAGKIKVFVSIPPQKTFVEEIGGPCVDVSVMVMPGYSPATYEPKPKQMADLAGTVVYFSIGVPFEKAWLDKIAATNPDMRLLRTDEGIEKVPIQSPYPVNKDKDSEKNNREEDHDHGTLDPHIWTSPPLVKIQARNILRGLLSVDPKNRTIYEKGYEKFTAEINALDAELKAIFKGKAGAAFMVFHPSWGYFARTYDLKQIPIEIEGKEPKPAQLKDLIQYAKKEKIKAVFAQPEFSAKSAKVIARAIGAEVVFVTPLAQDWKHNLVNTAIRFKAALK